MICRCHNCKISFISNGKLPEKCPSCGSTNISREITEKDADDEELEKIRRKKFERTFQDIIKKEVMTE